MRAAPLLALLVGAVLIAGSISLAVRDRSDRHATIDRALSNTAGDQAARLEEYFGRARSISLITAHDPSFRDFYSAPGSRAAKIRRRGAPIRRVESALAYLERLYPSSVGEACFIDRSGPENARFVNGVGAGSNALSQDESRSSFFTPTFALRAGQVYQAKPYVSPDTHTWVISNSTPLPGTGYPAAAIVHFEITLSSFRSMATEIAKGNEIAIVDKQTGRVLVDTESTQPPGHTADTRFAQLAARGTTRGTETFGGHRGAFRRLRRTAHNANDWYVVAIDQRPPVTLLREIGLAPLGMAAAAVALLLLAAVSFRSSRQALRDDERSRLLQEQRVAEERDYYITQREFTEIMQVTRDEDEAYQLLARHLERSIDRSEVVVLNRNNSHDRLEPMTQIPDNSPLLASLRDAEPDSCLAVRLGKTHERSPNSRPLLGCELCGVTNQTSTCVPSLVGGEVIGSVLVQHPSPLDATATRRVEESITQASPVLANLRNLALSNARALTDRLTGLPNRRSVDDTLKRMVAQAIRTSSPFSAVLFDLDHFKLINDLCGHEKGDEVLAAAGALIASTVRASDFAGRYGGEEFILLLPDTDRDGGVSVAEKLREAFAALQVAGVSRPITASFGVAAIPGDASESTLLLRAADRSLYLAKAQGRNQVATLAIEDADRILQPVASP